MINEETEKTINNTNEYTETLLQQIDELQTRISTLEQHIGYVLDK